MTPSKNLFRPGYRARSIFVPAWRAGMQHPER